MKILTISKKKIISDNKLSFLFLINKINYKKLKSIGKRPLLPHYVLYRFFLKAMKTTFIKTWYRQFAQSNRNLQTILPWSFLDKRMFYKNTKLLENYNVITNNYFWYNRSADNLLKKNYFFNKVNRHPIIGGQNVLTTSIKEDISGVFLKNPYKVETPTLNQHLLFNISLLNILEFYKILSLLFFFKIKN